MSRSLKKPIYFDVKLVRKVAKLSKQGKRGMQINTYARRSQIVPEMIGFIFGVHNGQKFIPVSVTESMIGHKLGEFAATRKMPVRKGNDKADR